MRTGTVSYKLEDLKKGVIIPIGFVGENDFTKVFFDAEEIYKKYPSASVSMKVQPPKGGIYPATVTRDGNTVIWQVKEADVANRGGGELQLTFTDGDTKIKTYIAKTDVKRSLAGNGPAPDPVQDWVDNAEEVLDDLAAMDNIAKTAEAGDIGKALSPKTVENGVVTEWQYVEPGAGTEDYTDLENKPQIGGVELSGDKSLHDLGIAAENDIPDISGKANLSVVAPAFDQATANDAGSLVTYTDGVVYVLPEGHTAGTTWENTQKTATNIAEQQRMLKNAIEGIEEELITGQAQTYTGVICTLEGQTAGDAISITPDSSVNKVYHTKKNLFNLLNRTQGTTTTGWGASNARVFDENEYYNGFTYTGPFEGEGYGVLSYITDGIAVNQGASGGGGGKGTVFPMKLPAGKYTISGTVYGMITVMYYGTDNVYASNEVVAQDTSSASAKTYTFTVPANTGWVVFHFANHKTRNYQYTNLMLVEGESAETYEACSFEKLASNISTITAYAGINKIWTDAGSFDIDTTVHRLTVIEDDIDELQEKAVVLDNDVIHRNLDQLPEVHACVSYGVHSGGVANNKRTIGILVTTDVHNRQQVMQNAIDYLNEYSFLDMGVCLGDITGSYFNDTDGTWYTDIVNGSEKPFYTTLGNHDLGNGTDSTNDKCVTVADAFNKWIKPTRDTMGMASLAVPYYAVHDTTYGISMIFLNSYDVPDTKSGDAFVVSRGTQGYSQTQIDWLISELANVPSDNHLILFQHCNVCDATKDEGAWTQKWNNLPNTGSFGDLIPDLINAWITGGTLEQTYASSVTGMDSITVDADFTERGTGVFVGHVFGHYHRDIMAHSTKYTGQKLVSLMCTADGLWQNGENDLPRVENTKTQDAITILSVNKTRRTINLVRVGSTKTISMTERNMIAISY